MYFTKVELHNFGIYKGTHEMSLTDKIGERNITLVGGLNGRGKTTFHDAILIALYGKQALKYIQEKARSYDKLLLDHINKHATDDETYCHHQFLRSRIKPTCCWPPPFPLRTVLPNLQGFRTCAGNHDHHPRHTNRSCKT